MKTRHTNIYGCCVSHENCILGAADNLNIGFLTLLGNMSLRPLLITTRIVSSTNYNSKVVNFISYENEMVKGFIDS